jgi:hypothetical protein
LDFVFRNAQGLRKFPTFSFFGHGDSLEMGIHQICHDILAIFHCDYFMGLMSIYMDEINGDLGFMEYQKGVSRI